MYVTMTWQLFVMALSLAALMRVALHCPLHVPAEMQADKMDAAHGQHSCIYRLVGGAADCIACLTKHHGFQECMLLGCYEHPPAA